MYPGKCSSSFDAGVLPPIVEPQGSVPEAPGTVRKPPRPFSTSRGRPVRAVAVVLLGLLLAGCATAATLLPALSWPLCLAAPAPLLAITVLFFGGASLSVRLLPASSGPRGLVPGILGAAALASALVTLVHPTVRDDLVRSVLSRPAYHLARGDDLQGQRGFRDAEREYRLAFTLEGGYDHDALGQGVASVLSSLIREDGPADANHAEGAGVDPETIQVARELGRLLSPYWKGI